MDRAEATGFGIAFAGHAALLVGLSLAFANARLPKLQNDPIEVSFVEEVGLESQAPTPSAEAPAPRLADEGGPIEPAATPPLPEPTPVPQVEPQPQPRIQPKAAPPAPSPRPQPTPQPKAQPRPAPKAAPARPAPKAAPPTRPQPKTAPATRPTGRLSGLLNGVGDTPSQSRSTTPPAQKAGPAVQASLAAEVRRQLKPHWKAPTGADVEALRTLVTVTLSRSGAIAEIGDISTTGVTPSNRAQVKLHQEQAVRAVRLAAPFRLPAEYYDAWKVIRPTFDRRLSQ
jgi:outer membrane biosynthesis protein TonB